MGEERHQFSIRQNNIQKQLLPTKKTETSCFRE
jgi:hypothetical protein